MQSLAHRLQPAQQQYIQTATNTLKRKASEMYGQYKRLTTAEQYQLTDDERLRRIDESKKELHQQYTFAKRLHTTL